MDPNPNAMGFTDSAQMLTAHIDLSKLEVTPAEFQAKLKAELTRLPQARVVECGFTKIGDQGTHLLCETLEEMGGHRVEFIDLWACGLTENSAKSLQRLILRPSVRRFNLRANKLGPVGARAVLMAAEARQPVLAPLEMLDLKMTGIEVEAVLQKHEYRLDRLECAKLISLIDSRYPQAGEQAPDPEPPGEGSAEGHPSPQASNGEPGNPESVTMLHLLPDHQTVITTPHLRPPSQSPQRPDDRVDELLKLIEEMYSNTNQRTTGAISKLLNRIESLEQTNRELSRRVEVSEQTNRELNRRVEELEGSRQGSQRGPTNRNHSARAAASSASPAR